VDTYFNIQSQNKYLIFGIIRNINIVFVLSVLPLSIVMFSKTPSAFKTKETQIIVIGIPSGTRQFIAFIYWHLSWYY
jgi:hypothetical protein